jgi:PadR family transcriptional regulator PadR
MAKDPKDLLHGTLDVLVLRTLADGPVHGYGITRAIEAKSGEVLPIEDAALYKALRRLEAIGAVDSEWGISDNNRRARFYRLTAKGRRELLAEADTWRRFAAAVQGVLGKS